MDRVTLLTAATRTTPCPACSARRLEFRLRCDLQDGACLTLARCRACGETFEIVAGPGPLGEHVLQESPEPCPRCGGRMRRAALHCELETHTCLYTLDCPTCTPA